MRYSNQQNTDLNQTNGKSIEESVFKVITLPKYEHELGKKRRSMYSSSFKKLSKAVVELAKTGNLGNLFDNHLLQPDAKLKKKYMFDRLWEFHLQSDVLVLYSVDSASKTVWLLDIGSHKQLFGESLTDVEYRKYRFLEYL